MMAVHWLVRNSLEVLDMMDNDCKHAVDYGSAMDNLWLQWQRCGLVVSNQANRTVEYHDC